MNLGFRLHSKYIKRMENFDKSQAIYQIFASSRLRTISVLEEIPIALLVIGS